MRAEPTKNKQTGVTVTVKKPAFVTCIISVPVISFKGAICHDMATFFKTRIRDVAPLINNN